MNTSSSLILTPPTSSAPPEMSTLNDTDNSTVAHQDDAREFGALLEKRIEKENPSDQKTSEVDGESNTKQASDIEGPDDSNLTAKMETTETDSGQDVSSAHQASLAETVVTTHVTTHITTTGTASEEASLENPVTDVLAPIEAANDTAAPSTLAETAQLTSSEIDQNLLTAEMELPRPDLAESSKLDIHKIVQSSTNPPTASSPANLSRKEFQAANQLTASTEVPLTTDADQSQWTGKDAPLNGRNLPGSLPFFTNKSGDQIQTAMATPWESTGKANVFSELFNTDLMNKAVAQSQQFLQATDFQAVQRQSDQADVNSSTTVNLNGVEKLSATRIPTGLAGESIRAFVIESPAGSNDWNNQLGDRIRWMSKINISSAELKLNPAELGSIEIKISTEDDQTKVSFIASSSASKEAIEASLPKLRDLLLSSGLQLEQSDVSQRNLAENNADENESTGSQNNNKDQSQMDEEPTQILRKLSENQIDHYV